MAYDMFVCRCDECQEGIVRQIKWFACASLREFRRDEEHNLPEPMQDGLYLMVSVSDQDEMRPCDCEGEFSLLAVVSGGKFAGFVKSDEIFPPLSVNEVQLDEHDRLQWDRLDMQKGTLSSDAMATITMVVQEMLVRPTRYPRMVSPLDA